MTVCSFEGIISSDGPVAQLVRAPPCHGGGRGFEPHPGRLQFTSADAGVAELADAQDLKSCGTYLPYRFDPGRRHLKFLQVCSSICYII